MASSAMREPPKTTQELDAILEEIPDDCGVIGEELNATCPSSSAEITTDVILQVLREIENDSALKPNFRAVSKDCQQRAEEIREALAFLTDCVDMKSKFHSAAKEASWMRFHRAVFTETTQLHSITKSPPFSSWLCLKLFTRLLNLLFKPTSTCPPKETAKYCSEEDDIVIYIGGSVIAKLKKAAYRLTDEEKGAHMDILSHLIDLNADDSSDSLTDILDRGGLIRLLPQIQAMFIEMECVFLELFSTFENTLISANEYRKECMNRDVILCGYYETTYASPTHNTVKMQILNSILGLYFRIRAYHKCKAYMEEYRQKKQIAKKQRALRKTLKT